MNILNNTKFEFLPFAGRNNYPKHSLTCVVKASFDLSHQKTTKLASEQAPVSTDEFYSDTNDSLESLYYPSDLAFFKPHGDFLFSGKCYTPNQKAMSACPVSIQVGEYKKTLNIYGSRFWKNVYIMPKTTDPKPFTEMDLTYERSFGGTDYDFNPIGRGAIKADVSVGDNVLPVPNIQDPDNPVTSPFVKTEPAGFGPLHHNWKTRKEKLGTYDKQYLKTRWPWFPEDFDWSYFNAAPEDQQIEGFLRGDEKLLFKNLHRKHEIYESQLPGIRPRCFIRKIDPKDGKRYFDEVKLNLDTLWVGMEEEKLVLVWRGWTDVLDEDFEEVKHLFLMQENLADEPASLEDCYKQFKQAQAAEDAEFGVSEKPAVGPDDPTEAFHKPKEKPKDSDESEKIKAKEKPTINKDELLKDVNTMLTQAGINLENFSPEIRAKIQAQQDKLFQKINASPEEKAELEQAELEQQLRDSLSELDLDYDNLPTLSPKAKQEQVRFFGEFGMNEADLASNPELDQMWSILGSALPKMGMDPENLSPLLEQNKEQFDKIKKQMNLNAEKETAEEPTEETHKEPEDPKKTEFKAGNSYAGQDLRDVDFSGLDLSGCDFSSCLLTGANFSDALLADCNFSKANLAGANFENVNLDHAKMDNTDAKGANFSHSHCNHVSINNSVFEDIQGNNSSWLGAKGKDPIFSRASLNQANFEEAQLPGAEFGSAELNEANFTKANLSEATFERVKASKSIFFQAIIPGLRASLGADFSGANFSQSQGESPIFMAANFERANLSFANLPVANFDRTNLQLANASAANFKQARFNKANLAQCNLSQANLMQSTFERSNLVHADLRGSNCYEVEFFNAEIHGLKTDKAILTASKLEYLST